MNCVKRIVNGLFAGSYIYAATQILPGIDNPVIGLAAVFAFATAITVTFCAAVTGRGCLKENPPPHESQNCRC